MYKRSVDYVIVLCVAFLIIFGLVMVYSASNVVANYRFQDSWYFFKRQLIFAVIGLVVMVGIIKLDLHRFKKYTTVIFFVSIALLIIVLIPGVGDVRGGARSWIGFGYFSLQPAEFAKLSIVMLIAKYISVYYEDLKKFKVFIAFLALIGVVFLLIMLQPDFGTGLVLVISAVLLLFLSGAPLKYFGLCLVVGLVGITGLILSAPYRLKRILAFLDPWQDPLGSGFQGIQSLFAIAPGGLFGLGFNRSMQKHFFLPEPQNDFIFAIVIEELGLIGGIILISAYTILFVKTVQNAMRIEDHYPRFLSLGIAVSLYVQVFINVAVVIGLLPVTGITLPFLSYGGSSLLLSMISVGIILNVSRYREYD